MIGNIISAIEGTIIAMCAATGNVQRHISDNRRIGEGEIIAHFTTQPLRAAGLTVVSRNYTDTGVAISIEGPEDKVAAIVSET